MMRKTGFVLLMMVILFGSILNSTGGAEVMEVRLAKQYGLSYLPLMVVEAHKLIEKHAKAAGLGKVKTNWVILGNGASSNDALLSGSVDFISGGVAPFIILWDKTKGNVKSLAALDNTPNYLNTVNPAVKTLGDFSDRDRIALPAVKVSIQAVLLQMAVAQEFGIRNYNRLDKLTVSLKHPDALIALLSGQSEISAHFTSPPYSFQELENPKVRKIVDSYAVLGGPHTMNLISTTGNFYTHNPKLIKATLKALNEAIAWIKQDKRRAAELYVKASQTNESVNAILTLLNNPQIDYNTAPVRIIKFSDFLYRTGTISTKPASWKELFFPEIHRQKGS